jgi:hypothetical protein
MHLVQENHALPSPRQRGVSGGGRVDAESLYACTSRGPAEAPNHRRGRRSKEARFAEARCVNGALGGPTEVVPE